jgi:hypothetical protein
MKVVTVAVPDKDEPPPLPLLGEVYTVSKIWIIGEEVMIDLVELPFPGVDGFYPGYRARAFRPVQTRKTDISIFTEMLKKTKERA